MERHRDADAAASAGGGSASIGDLLTARAVGLDRALRFDTTSQEVVSVPSLSDLMDVEIAPAELAPDASVEDVRSRAEPPSVHMARGSANGAPMRGGRHLAGSRGVRTGTAGAGGARRPRPPWRRAPHAVPGRARACVNSDGSGAQRGARASAHPRKAVQARRPSAPADTQSDGGPQASGGGFSGDSGREYCASDGVEEVLALGAELNGCGGTSVGQTLCGPATNARPPPFPGPAPAFGGRTVPSRG